MKRHFATVNTRVLIQSYLFGHASEALCSMLSSQKFEDISKKKLWSEAT